MTLTSTYNTKQAAQKCVLENRELYAIKIQITQNQVTSFTLAAFFARRSSRTAALPLGCTTNCGKP